MNEIEVKAGMLVLHNTSNQEVFVNEDSIDIVEPSATGTRIHSYGSTVDVKEQPNEVMAALQEEYDDDLD